QKAAFQFTPRPVGQNGFGAMVPPTAPAARAPQQPAAPQSKPPAPAPPPARRPAAAGVPPTPPRPANRPPAVQTPSRSLLDLAAQGPRQATEPPQIPSIAAEMAVPPLARPVASRPQARRNLTTAFDGLAGGEGVRNTDVFSQMAAPISAEAFGSRGNPDEV